jgi:3-hydroxyisobutyrate dehydrogenase
LRPIFDTFSQSLNYFGAAGMGQHAKMANQIMIAGTMTGLTEMLVYAKAAGLDLQQVINTVGGGAGANWSMSNYGPTDLSRGLHARLFHQAFCQRLAHRLARS